MLVCGVQIVERERERGGGGGGGWRESLWILQGRCFTYVQVRFLFHILNVILVCKNKVFFSAKQLFVELACGHLFRAL